MSYRIETEIEKVIKYLGPQKGTEWIQIHKVYFHIWRRIEQQMGGGIG